MGQGEPDQAAEDRQPPLARAVPGEVDRAARGAVRRAQRQGGGRARGGGGGGPRDPGLGRRGRGRGGLAGDGAGGAGGGSAAERARARKSARARPRGLSARSSPSSPPARRRAPALAASWAPTTTSPRARCCATSPPRRRRRSGRRARGTCSPPRRARRGARASRRASRAVWRRERSFPGASSCRLTGARWSCAPLSTSSAAVGTSSWTPLCWLCAIEASPSRRRSSPSRGASGRRTLSRRRSAAGSRTANRRGSTPSATATRALAAEDFAAFARHVAAGVWEPDVDERNANAKPAWLRRVLAGETRFETLAARPAGVGSSAVSVTEPAPGLFLACLSSARAEDVARWGALCVASKTRSARGPLGAAVLARLQMETAKQPDGDGALAGPDALLRTFLEVYCPFGHEMGWSSLRAMLRPAATGRANAEKSSARLRLRDAGEVVTLPRRTPGNLEGVTLCEVRRPLREVLAGFHELLAGPTEPDMTQAAPAEALRRRRAPRRGPWTTARACPFRRARRGRKLPSRRRPRAGSPPTSLRPPRRRGTTRRRGRVRPPRRGTRRTRGKKRRSAATSRRGWTRARARARRRKRRRRLTKPLARTTRTPSRARPPRAPRRARASGSAHAGHRGGRGSGPWRGRGRGGEELRSRERPAGAARARGEDAGDEDAGGGGDARDALEDARRGREDAEENLFGNREENLFGFEETLFEETLFRARRRGVRLGSPRRVVPARRRAPPARRAEWVRQRGPDEVRRDRDAPRRQPMRRARLGPSRDARRVRAPRQPLDQVPRRGGFRRAPAGRLLPGRVAARGGSARPRDLRRPSVARRLARRGRGPGGARRREALVVSVAKGAGSRLGGRRASVRGARRRRRAVPVIQPHRARHARGGAPRGRRARLHRLGQGRAHPRGAAPKMSPSSTRGPSPAPTPPPAARAPPPPPPRAARASLPSSSRAGSRGPVPAWRSTFSAARWSARSPTRSRAHVRRGRRGGGRRGGAAGAAVDVARRRLPARRSPRLRRRRPRRRRAKSLVVPGPSACPRRTARCRLWARGAGSSRRVTSARSGCL